MDSGNETDEGYQAEGQGLLQENHHLLVRIVGFVF